MKNSEANFSAYLESDLEKFRGKWIIIYGDSVVASGKDIKKLILEVQEKFPDKKFLLARVPEEGTMIF